MLGIRDFKEYRRERKEVKQILSPENPHFY